MPASGLHGEAKRGEAYGRLGNQAALPATGQATEMTSYIIGLGQVYGRQVYVWVRKTLGQQTNSGPTPF